MAPPRGGVRSPDTARANHTGLWCAGTHGTWPNYQPATGGAEGTQGFATVDLAALSGFYSANLAFDYTMPSLLPKDNTGLFAPFSLTWDYVPTNGQPTVVGLPIVASWVHKTYSLSQTGGDVALSRQPGTAVFSFAQAQLGGASGSGQGPTIDNVAVTGWKYGPVRSLMTTGTTSLTWNRPWRSTAATSTEDRTISYRVWKKTSGQGDWTELTASGRLTGAGDSVTYDTLAPTSGVAFIVQAWDSGTGDGYGQYVRIGNAVPPVVRLAGATRYQTAVMVSEHQFSAGSVDNIIIASGENYPDALSAAGLAGAAAGPVLLVPPDAVIGNRPAAVASITAEINRIKSGTPKLWIVGGTGSTKAPVVPDAIVNVIKQKTGITVTQRMGGIDRYDTSRQVAVQVKTLVGGSFANTAFVVDGRTFQDALTVGPVAYAQKWPVILTAPTSLSTYTSQAITANTVHTVYMVGGSSNISTSVESAIRGVSGVTHAERIVGQSDAYARTAAFGTWALAHVPGTAMMATGISSGALFPDGLGSSSLLGSSHGVGLLTNPTSLSAPDSSFLTTNKSSVGTLTIFGGTGAVSTTAENQAKAAVQ